MTEPTTPPTAPEPGTSPAVAVPSDKLVLCPYCGAANRGTDRCRGCGGLFEPLSQLATQIAMGPWYLRDTTNPFRPGCSYDVLTGMITAGRIQPHTVVRGPTTRQFWSVARHVEGIAHLLGYCHACGAHVAPTDPTCSDCGAAFGPVRARNELGLRFKTPAEAAQAQVELDQLRQAATTGHPPRKARPRSAKPATETTSNRPGPSTGLLDGITTADAADAEALDFAPTPSPAGDNTAPAAPPGPDGIARTTIAIWVLAVLNVIAFGLLTLLYLWTRPS